MTEKSLKWQFAETSGGLERGLNDAAVHTFKGGIYRYLAREIIQNSCDARYDETRPVRVAFALENLGASSIPDIEGLRVAFHRCELYWSYDKRALTDLWAGIAAIERPTIPCLKISDYNTRGLTGDDDDRKGNWYLLIRCAGSSAKSGSAGGSFGIGKGAPFAASEARTVLYSTRTSGNDVAFQGVALLASHRDDRGALLQPTAFLENPSGDAIRSEPDIPLIFQRSQRGTDIWVVACVDTADWKNQLIRSVLESFWPAITLNQLEVAVGKEHISSQSLGKFMTAFSGDGDFTANAYFDAYENPTIDPIIEELPEIGKCALYLAVQENLGQKRVAMIRKTGMVIEFRQYRSPVPFTGVFICLSDKGNEKLAQMEPPRHDKWDPNHPTEKANTKVHNVITNFVRAGIRRLSPVDLSKRIMIPGLERFLPDIEDHDLESWGDGEAKGESFEHRPPDQLAVVKIAVRKQRSSIEPATSSDVADSLVGPELDDPSESERASPRRSGQDDEAKARRDDDGTPHKAVPITYRTYLSDQASGQYVATIHPEETCPNAMLRIFAVGEDVRSQEKPISAMADGIRLHITEAGLIGPIPLVKGRELRIELQVTASDRLAFEVAANEAS